MARSLRIEYPNALYHVVSRGNSRQKIFKNKNDFEQFMIIFDDVLDRHNWICHSYCLMSNHYHLLIETPDANLSQGMRHLNGVYTQKFNYIHKNVGHLFQGRYKAIVVEKEKYLFELMRYITLNPVRAKLAKRPEDWRWGSYREVVYNKKDKLVNPRTILDKFGSILEFKKFVNQKINDKSVWDELYNDIVLGTHEFRNKLQSYILKERKSSKEISKKSRFIGRPSLLKLFEGVVSNKEKRNELVYRANIEYGYSLTKIGEYLNVHYSTLSKIIKEMRNKRLKQ